MLFEYSVDDCVGRRDGRSVYPTQLASASSIAGIHTDNSDILVVCQLSRNSGFTVTSCFSSQIDDHGAGFHSGNHLTRQRRYSFAVVTYLLGN